MTTTTVVLQDLTTPASNRGPSLSSQPTREHTSAAQAPSAATQKVADFVQQKDSATAIAACSTRFKDTDPISQPQVDGASTSSCQDEGEQHGSTKQFTCMICAFHLFTDESTIALPPNVAPPCIACISDKTFGASSSVERILYNIDREGPTLDVDCACNFARPRWDSCTDLNGDAAIKPSFEIGDHNHLEPDANRILCEDSDKIVQVPNAYRQSETYKDFVKTPIFYRQKYPILSLAITPEHQDVKISNESLSRPDPLRKEELRKAFAIRNTEWDAVSQRRLRDQISFSPEEDDEEGFGHDSAPSPSLLAADAELAKFWANKKYLGGGHYLDLRWRARRHLGLLYGSDGKLVKLDDQVLEGYKIREERALAAWIGKQRKQDREKESDRLSEDPDCAIVDGDDTPRPSLAFRMPERRIPAAPWREVTLQTPLQGAAMFNELTTDDPTSMAYCDTVIRGEVQDDTPRGRPARATGHPNEY